MTDKIENFNIKAIAVFQPVLEKYGYQLEEVKINELNGQNWSVHHVYVNNTSGLKIILKQEPYYTDYGFSFVIINVASDEYNILCNVPHEKQDTDDKFLEKVCRELFSNPDVVDVISGSWKELKSVPFQY